MTSTTASTVTSSISAVHGIPSEIYLDNGPPFASDAMKQFMRARTINHSLVTPSRPREVESFTKPLGKAVKEAKMEGKDWKAQLQCFLLAYRTTPYCTTMRLNRESEKYFNGGENRTHDLDAASVNIKVVSSILTVVDNDLNVLFKPVNHDSRS